MDNKELLRTFIMNELCEGKTLRQLSDDEPLVESGIIDSLGILKLLAFLDETFGIILSEEELTPENFSNFNILCAFIEKKTEVAA